MVGVGGTGDSGDVGSVLVLVLVDLNPGGALASTMAS